MHFRNSKLFYFSQQLFVKRSCAFKVVRLNSNMKFTLTWHNSVLTLQSKIKLKQFKPCKLQIFQMKKIRQREDFSIFMKPFTHDIQGYPQRMRRQRRPLRNLLKFI